MHLQGKVALVTGAGSGIGKASALLLAEHGAHVACLSRSEDELREVCDTIISAGGQAMALVADVSLPDDRGRAVEATVGRWVRIDLVLANAGINGVWAPLKELTVEEWETTIKINLTGTFLTVKAALPQLTRRGGSVIITASVNGTRMFSNTGASAYATSKAGQVAFAKMIALELAKDRVRVNVICPGAIDTEIDDSTQKRGIEQARVPVEFPAGKIPLTDGKPGSSEQVAQLVLFLASDASSHISGTEIFIDGAQSLLQG